MQFKKLPLAIAVSLLASPCAYANNELTAELAPVVVSATRFAVPSDSIPAGVTVITSDDIQASGARSAAEAIQRVTGVAAHLDTTGGRNPSLDLRGFAETAGSNTVILVDGVRMQEGDQSAVVTSWVPVETIDRIEIVRGAGAVEYGQGATAGVINIITKQPSGNTGYLYAGLGSFASKDLRAGVTTGKDGFSLSANGYSYHTDNHRAQFQNRDEGASLKLQFAADATKVGVRVNAATGQQVYPGGLTSQQFAQNPHQANPNYRNYWGKTDDEMVAVFGETRVGSWTLAADLSGREKHTYTYQDHALYGLTILSDATRATQLSVRAKRDTETPELNNSLTLGYDLNNWNKVRSGSTFLHESDGGVYLRNSTTLNATKTTLTAGARYEQSNRTLAGDAIGQINENLNAWDFGVNQPLTGGLSAFARAGTSYRLPNADDYACYPNFGCGAFVPLLAQKSHDYEAGLRLKAAAVTAQLRGYRYLLSNEIAYLNPAYANVNLDPTLRQGVELEASIRVIDALTVKTALTARQAKFRSGQYDGNEVPLVSKYLASLRAEWKPASNQTVGAGWQWASSQRVGDDWDNQSNVRVPSYWTVNAGYTYQWKSTQFSLTANNLTNRSYYVYRTYATGGAIYPEPGRSIMAGVRINY